MTPLQQSHAASGIGIPWILLKRLEEAKQSAAAEASGIDEGTLSKFKSGFGCIKIATLRLLLQHLGLKLVSSDSVCVKREEYLSLTRIAGRALQERPQLFFEDDPE